MNAMINPDLALLSASAAKALPAPLCQLCAAPAGWHALSHADARALADALKTAADQHWHIAPQRSVLFADAIIALGLARGDAWIRALGTMAKGDALKFFGSQQQAWDLLVDAGRMFLGAGDEVGWGRTLIGRLFVSAQLNRLGDVLPHIPRARAIFERHGETLRRLRLELALGEVHSLVENPALAEQHYHNALEIAEQLGSAGAQEARAIYNNLGVLAQTTGRQHRALAYFSKGLALARAHREPTAEVIYLLNIAGSHLRLGRFRQALHELTEVRPRYEEYFRGGAELVADLACCQLALNRFSETVALCEEARTWMLAAGSLLSAAKIDLLRAQAEAGAGDLAAAGASLERATAAFSQEGDTGLLWVSRLRSAQLAGRAGHHAQALHLVRECRDAFDSAGQLSYAAEAQLLLAEMLAALHSHDEARAAAWQALERARACHALPLRSAAHLLRGRVAEQRGEARRALRSFATAEALVQRQLRELTITLRPAFMADKTDAHRSLVRVQLAQGLHAAAFDTVERARALAIHGYLTDRDALRWPAGDEQVRALIEELSTLRDNHRVLHSTRRESLAGGDAPVIAEDIRRARQTGIEARMRAVSEALYLRSGVHSGAHARPFAATPPGVSALQQALRHDEALIAYFNDDRHMRVWVLRADALTCDTLPISPAQLADATATYSRNLSRAVTLGAAAAGGAHGLNQIAHDLSRRLYDMLLQPVAPALHGISRLYVVPCGQLHTLPFNTLHDGHRFLIERCNLVMLPAASLLLHRPPRSQAGVRVVVNDLDGRLHSVHAEARMLRGLFEATVWDGADATRQALDAGPAQILHIAAHGAFRADAPDFSHLTLADGNVFTDDLLQLDLDHALVTLSACESGRGRIAANDDVLGLGWALLYAGAGAVIASLWRVDDAATLTLMTTLYRALRGGADKAQALGEAQRQVLAQHPDAHPALWGAFQLIGDPSPLAEP